MSLLSSMNTFYTLDDADAAATSAGADDADADDDADVEDMMMLMLLLDQVYDVQTIWLGWFAAPASKKS